MARPCEDLAAGHGGAAAQTTIGVYSVVFGLYAALRIYRALADARETKRPGRTSVDKDGFSSTTALD